MKQIKISLLIFFLYLGIVSGNFQPQEKEMNIKYSVVEDKSYQNIIRFELRVSKHAMLSKTVTEMLMGRTIRGESGRPVGNEKYIKEFHKFVYKDYSANKMEYEAQAIYGNVTVKEDLTLFKWELANNTDTVLGYVCREATAKFRGRDYIAYFTTEIPFKAAPWKFHGLPGVMLKVFSKDGYLKAEAISLEILPLSEPIENPFEKDEPLSMDEYLELCKKRLEKKREELRRINAMGDGPPTKTVRIPNIEILDY